jgi:hypothetical protein
LEEWFDLTQPGFQPSFSMTIRGGQRRFGFRVDRETKAALSVNRLVGLDQIEVALQVRFSGVGLDQDATYSAVYQRRDGEKSFRIVTAFAGLGRLSRIPTADFEAIADPYSGLSNERLLYYALPGLRRKFRR